MVRLLRGDRPITLGFVEDGAERGVPGTHKHRAAELRMYFRVARVLITRGLFVR